jgi:hypothetical protein
MLPAESQFSRHKTSRSYAKNFVQIRYQNENLSSLYVSFQYRNETLRFIEALPCANRKQNSNVQENCTYRVGKKERNIRFFKNESKKRIVFDHTKTKRWHHYTGGTGLQLTKVNINVKPYPCLQQFYFYQRRGQDSLKKKKLKYRYILFIKIF